MSTDHETVVAVGGHRRAQQTLQTAAVGALPESLGLGAHGEPARVKPHVQTIPKAKPPGELRQLGEEAESSPRVSLDVSLVEVKPIDLGTPPELPEDRLQRQERIFSLGVAAARGTFGFSKV
jgi:hypothetical protein